MNRKWTIQRKFFLGFLLIFSVSLVLLNLFISNMLNKNSENMIKAEMENTQQYSREYVKQYFQLKELTRDIFREAGNALAQELSQNLQMNVTLYDIEGQFLYEALGGKEYIIVNSSPSKLLEESGESDLQMALNNKSAFTIQQMDDQWIVNFSYPFYLNGEHYGIIRLTKDYTSLFQSNQKVLTSLTLFTLVLFLTIFMFSYFLSRRITKPLSKVTKSFIEVAQGYYDTHLHITTGDEIEELNDRFHEMKDQIKEQISVITKEKEKVEKLAATRREFFNNVTHELKTPLTTISGYSQILSEDHFDDPVFMKKAAKRIKKESDRLHQMVVDVIELSKQTTFEMEKIDLSQMIQQLCEDLQIKAAKYNMTIQWEIGNRVYVRGVENRLLEVVINLLDNAIKYGDADTSIEVKLYQQTEDAIILISNHCNHFNRTILDKAFEPFSRGRHHSKEEKGSSGLGLYICKQIVAEHNGTIVMEEHQGVIRLTVRLPLWQ